MDHLWVQMDHLRTEVVHYFVIESTWIDGRW